MDVILVCLDRKTDIFRFLTQLLTNILIQILDHGSHDNMTADTAHCDNVQVCLTTILVVHFNILKIYETRKTTRSSLLEDQLENLLEDLLVNLLEYQLLNLR